MAERADEIEAMVDLTTDPIVVRCVYNETMRCWLADDSNICWERLLVVSKHMNPADQEAQAWF